MSCQTLQSQNQPSFWDEKCTPNGLHFFQNRPPVASIIRVGYNVLPNTTKPKPVQFFEMKNADPMACISFKTDPLWQADHIIIIITIYWHMF